MTVKTINRIPQNIISNPKPSEIFLPDDNNFPYGWRMVAETLTDGLTAYHRVPLTQADYLNPQEGDQLIQASKHARLSISIFNMLDNYYQETPEAEVFFDLKMRWGILNLEEPAPDVAVVPDIKNKGKNRPSFDVRAEETRPCLVIEVVSPDYPGDDTDKVRIYSHAGVEEYIIIDPNSGDDGIECKIWGYYLTDTGYQKMAVNSEGQVLSETTGILFKPDESKEWVRLIDSETGDYLLTANEEREARLEAEARAKAEAKGRQEAEAYAAKLEAYIQTLTAKKDESEET